MSLTGSRADLRCVWPTYPQTAHTLLVVGLAVNHFLPPSFVGGQIGAWRRTVNGPWENSSLRTSQRGRQKTSWIYFAVIFSVAFNMSCNVLLGSFPGCKKGIAVPPSTLQRLEVGIGVVSQQVLFQVIHNAKYQSTAIPPTAVILHQIEPHSLDAAIITASVNHTLMDGHTHNHVFVPSINLQSIMGLKQKKNN